MRHGFEVVGFRYADRRANGKYHLYEDNGRVKLCDCGAFIELEKRLGLGRHKHWKGRKDRKGKQYFLPWRP